MTPVFIGGSGRSGTTMVVDLLGLHPRLSPVYETDFLPAVLQQLTQGRPLAEIEAALRAWSQQFTDKPSAKRAHERYHHGPHHLRFSRARMEAHIDRLLTAIAAGHPVPALREMVFDLFAEHAAADNKPRWVSKAPPYIATLGALHQVFPELRFLHCVRDGRDVACSVLTRTWGPADVPTAARWWAARIDVGRRFAARFPDQIHEVRYEDLLQRPEETLAAALAFIGEPPEDAALIVARHRAAGMTFDAGRAGGWRRQLSPQDVARFEQLAGAQLAALGYAA